MPSSIEMSSREIRVRQTASSWGVLVTRSNADRMPWGKDMAEAQKYPEQDEVWDCPSHHLTRQVTLDFIDVDASVELLADGGKAFAGDPDLQLRFEVEGSGSFEGESGDTFIRKGFVLHLAAGESLHIDQDQSLVGEHKRVPDQLKSQFDLLVVTEQPTVLLHQLLDGDLACIPEYFIE